MAARVLFVHMEIRHAVAGVLAVALLVGLPAVAQAGMPSISLSDVAEMRLSALSFFGASFLVSALGIQRLWNRLQRDFPQLPRLTFKAAVVVVFLWGMLFVLVLTMISGARELMTPGAWEKKGLTYKLASAGEAEILSEPQDPLDRRRKQQLQQLHVQLLGYAARHNGDFPPDESPGGIDPKSWNLPDRLGTRYLYVPGRSIQEVAEILAFEPQVYDGPQLVLWTDGRVQARSISELQHALD